MSRKKAFTLIELLVVISMIALLLSAQVPSRGMAKERSKQLVCKQISGGSAFRSCCIWTIMKAGPALTMGTGMNGWALRPASQTRSGWTDLFHK